MRCKLITCIAGHRGTSRDGSHAGSKRLKWKHQAKRSAPSSQFQVPSPSPLFVGPCLWCNWGRGDRELGGKRRRVGPAQTVPPPIWTPASGPQPRTGLALVSAAAPDLAAAAACHPHSQCLPEYQMDRSGRPGGWMDERRMADGGWQQRTSLWFLICPQGASVFPFIEV